MSSEIINNNIEEAEPNETSEKWTAWHIKLKYSAVLSPGDSFTIFYSFYSLQSKRLAIVQT